jgi:pSer/pThr/pTyr-binding forkhead associated (FHA) protein
MLTTPQQHMRCQMNNPTKNESPPKNTVFLIVNRQITPLVKTITRLGRQLDNDVVIQEESISRNHAEICLENGLYVLYDRQSTSGTYVNSRRIERCVLNSGDLIALAGVQIMFVNNNPNIADRSAIKTGSLSSQKLNREEIDGN